MGEGGAITTSCAKKSAHMKSLRHHGMVSEESQFKNKKEGPWYHEFHELGFNYRASDIHCALGLSQLKKIDKFIFPKWCFAPDE